MIPIQIIDTNIELCGRLKEQIESDCYVSINEIGGKSLKAYETVRKTQLSEINKIYIRLCTLRSLLNNF